MKKKKIIIFTAAYGGGHNSVSNALRDYLVKRYATRVSVEIIDFMERFAVCSIMTYFGSSQFSAGMGDSSADEAGTGSLTSGVVEILPLVIRTRL